MLQIKNIKKYKKNNNYYDVSIIIPTKDFLESLVQTIEGILSQKKYPKEIIIIVRINILMLFLVKCISSISTQKFDIF